MFGKKMPLQKQQQIFQEQYSEEQSEPLIEQVDTAYEPTDKEVKEYAIQTLGMKLPEDQNLLYLARQGLKAPITANWVPYQSRNGQIYYKHNITQQKTYDHPTDTQYRKKYQQIKEKAARKNLKSISMKQNLGMQGLLPSNSLTSGFGLQNNSGIGLSNASGLSAGEDIAQPTIDDELIRQLELDLSEHEKKQQKQWREFQAEVEEQHQKKIKRIKDQYDEERNRLADKNSRKNQSKALEEQKARIEQNLEESEESTLNDQIRLLEKQQEGKLSEYRAVYQEDNTIKLRKIQQDLLQNYEDKTKLLEEKLRKLSERREKQRENRIRVLKQTKEELQKPNNPQIMALLHSRLEDNLAAIKAQYAKKLKEKEAELQGQLLQMKRILGVDKSQTLLSLASRKQKLISLSNLKISAKKNKQLQIIETETQKSTEIQKQRLKQALSIECDEQIQNKKRQLQQKIQKTKAQLQSEYIQKSTKQIEQIYQSTAVDKSNYEGSMNKKMSQLRMKYINKISEQPKNKGKDDKVVNRIIMQEKESQIQNKQQHLKNLEKQLDLEREEWKVLLFEEEIGQLMGKADKDSTVTSYLKQKMKQMNIPYKSPQQLHFSQNLQQLQSKYSDDKKFLVKILQGIQDTTAHNLAEMRRNNLDGENGNLGSGVLIKKYNQDVRKMRLNQDMLNRYEVLVRKVELGGSGYEQNMQNLRTFAENQMTYHEIALKTQLKKGSSQNRPNPSQENPHSQKHLQAVKMDEAPYPQPDPKNSPWSTPSMPANSMQQALRKHSQFLSNVKNELNRKLYQVRYDYRY